MTAVRLARGATGRDHDREVRRLLPRPPRRAARRGRAAAWRRSGSRARPASRRARSPTRSSCRTTTSPRVDAALADHDVAAVLVEPIAANMGLVPPAPGFLDDLRERCTAAGALLVFDEVITGFRVGLGGEQVRQGIAPDLSIFGKVVGGGLPLAAVGGRAAVMDQLAPLGPVYQAGTLSGNPLATAAGLAALGALDAASVRRRSRRRRRASSTGCSAPSTPPAIPAGRHAGRDARRAVLRAAPVTDYARRAAGRPRAVRTVLPRHARPRRVLRAERLRDDVRVARPRRRR